MEDRMLTARLRALRNNLAFVSKRLESSDWLLPEEPGRRKSAVLEAQRLWESPDMGLIQDIKTRQDKIKEIEESISNPAQPTEDVMKRAWLGYADVLEKSQEILRECFEIIGALAIRAKDPDLRILYVADKLIHESLSFSLSREQSDYYLLVHAVEDTFTRAKARIIRLRFSDWTIWDLPLAGHELGHVVLELILDQEWSASRSKKQDFPPVLEPLVRELRDQRIQQDPELQKLSQRDETGAQTAQEWAESRVHELLADTFATYTMGPAYACSAILLRLNPATPASGMRPSDAQRAEVILGMLRCMNGSMLYTGVIDPLKGAWDTALGRVQSSVQLEDQDKQGLQVLAETMFKSGWRKTLYAALYPVDQGREGWPTAKLWSAKWQAQWKERKRTLSQPEETPTGKLRDVLNAAWSCRLDLETNDIPEHAAASQELAKVAQELCETIIARERAPSPGRTRAAPHNPGGGK